MRLQEAQKTPLSDFPIFSGTNVEPRRQALSCIFNLESLEPGKNLKSFQFSVHGVQLSHLWISSLSYLGNPEFEPIEPSNYHTLQVIPSGNIQFDIHGRKIKANAAQAPLYPMASACDYIRKAIVQFQLVQENSSDTSAGERYQIRERDL